MIKSSEESYLNSGIIVKALVKAMFPLKVKADTLVSPAPEVAVKNSGLKPKEKESENVFCKYKATP